MERKYYMVRTRTNEDYYADKGVVAVGWSDIEFTNFENDIERLKEQIAEIEKGRNLSIVGRKKEEAARFLRIAKDDVIVVPSYCSFYIATSTGEYLYDVKSKNDDLANQLKVQFVLDKDGKPLMFEREGKNLALVTKLRSRGFTVLDINDHSIISEIERLRNQCKDVSSSSIVIQKENDKRAEFKNSLVRNISNYSRLSLPSGGVGFEKLIKKMLEVDGFVVKILPKTVGKRNADVDLLAIKESTLGREFSTAFYIQAKHHTGTTSDFGLQQVKEFKKQVNELLSSKAEEVNELPYIGENLHYVLISSAEFSESTKEDAAYEGVICIDGMRVAEMLFERFDELDEYKYQLGYYKQFIHLGDNERY